MNNNFRDYSQTQRIPRVSERDAQRRDTSFDYTIPSAGKRAGTNASRPQNSSRSRGNDGYTSYAMSNNRGSNRNSGYYGKSRTGSGSSRSSAAARRRRKKEERAVMLGLLFLLLLLSATVFVVFRSCNTPDQPAVLDPATDTFRENVVINGTVVTGMTIDQARTVLQPGIEQDINAIAITLAGDGFSELITGTEMNAASDLETVLSSALAGGENQNYDTKISLDYDALGLRIADINTTLSYGATNASFTLETNDKGKPVLNYIEGTPGMGFDLEATTALVREALESGNYTATLSPALTTVQPTVTVADLKAQVTEIGRYSTTYCAELPSDQPEEDRMVIENRSFNIAKCSEIINGEIVNPGKTWSFNKTVGDRNEKNGWKQAKGIYGGETYNMQYGGGVCQVSTTLYVALMRAGMPFDEISRREHSIPSTYVPLGLDATVDSGHIDFKFKNTTEYPIYIFAYSTVNKNRSRYRDLTVVIYGKALPEGVTYDLRSVTIEELEPGEPIITYDNKQTTEYNVLNVEARKGYVVDVYLDKFVNKKLESSTKLYEDRYEAITEKRTIGTQSPATPTPAITAPPSVPQDNTDEMP